VPEETWIDIKEAIEAAKTSVSTIVVTLLFKRNNVLTFIVEVHGIEQMVSIIKDLDKMQAKKKIVKYVTNNLTTAPAVDVVAFKKVLSEL
jgi:hypothetical protein